MMKTRSIYYALLLFVALLFVIVFAFALQAAFDGHPIAWLLMPLMLFFGYTIMDDAMSIIQEITE